MNELSDLFEEVSGEQEDGIDNPDLGADHENDSVQEDEIVDEDADTSDDDDVEIEDDDVEDDDDDESDEPVAEEDDFDWNEILDKYGDRTVTVTVQGEPVEVAIKDLPNGFMMREDYSRKTAEVSQVRNAAQWAQDVQAAFANDPVGTLEAFARAYGIDPSQSANQPQTPEVDPYEDLDPDVAAVLRRMDEQERAHQAELEQVRSQVEQFQNQQIMEEVKAEVRGLQEEFGDDLDTTEMLRLAATYNMPLREAAEHLVGKQYFAKSKEQMALEAQAAQAAESRQRSDRSRQKKRASSTATKKFDASDVSVEDFNTIGELFEIEMNSIS